MQRDTLQCTGMHCGTKRSLRLTRHHAMIKNRYVAIQSGKWHNIALISRRTVQLNQATSHHAMMAHHITAQKGFGLFRSLLYRHGLCWISPNNPTFLSLIWQNSAKSVSVKNKTALRLQEETCNKTLWIRPVNDKSFIFGSKFVFSVRKKWMQIEIWSIYCLPNAPTVLHMMLYCLILASNCHHTKTNNNTKYSIRQSISQSLYQSINQSIS